MAVAHHAQHVQVDVPALRGVRDERETHGVRAALGDALGVILSLPGLRFLHLRRLQIPALQSLVQVLQRDALDDVQGVDDVPERLGHLPAVRVPHHGVQVHLLERNLPGELHAHHHHARHPEEHDVVAGFQQRRRVELGEVGALVRPPEHREREQTGGEPGVQHVLVLFQREGFAGELRLRLFPRLRFFAADDPAVELLARAPRHAGVLGGFALELDVVRRDAVPPPKLPRDAPVADVLQPPKPRGFHERGDDLELLRPRRLARVRRHRRAVHPPLRFQHRLDHVLRPRTQTEPHRVGGFALVQTQLVQRVDHGFARGEPLQPSEPIASLVVD